MQEKVKIVFPQHLLPLYARRDVAFEYGEGAYLFDAVGKKYLDFSSGLGVNILGHQSTPLMRTLAANIARPWHVSNGCRVFQAEELAAVIFDNFGFDSVFWCNSGTESVECAIKSARAYYRLAGKKEDPEILVFKGAFHGRGWGSMSASDHDKSYDIFAPKLSGFKFCELTEESVLANLSERTAAIFLEPIQGHAGAVEFPEHFLRFLRTLCDKNDILLCYDCIQSGYGRSGEFFAYELSGAKPDIAMVAKGMAGGLPMGGCLFQAKAAVLKTGQHGSTLGGNPLCCSMALTVFDEVTGLLPHISFISRYLDMRLIDLVKANSDIIVCLKGRGLLRGIWLNPLAAKAIDASQLLLARGIITVPSGNNAIRILPPYIIQESHVDEMIAILTECFGHIRCSMAG